jgi:hypothetical protein
MERIRVFFLVLVAALTLGLSSCGGGSSDGGGGSVFAPPLFWGQNNWDQSAWQ